MRDDGGISWSGARTACAVVIIGLGVTACVFAAPALGQETAGDDGGTSFKDLATGIGAAVGALLVLLGAPSIYLGIKKSQAEIRKLELETAKLKAETGGLAVRTPKAPGETYNVVIEGRGNVVSIIADPRLLGPLLLLLDFVTATIVLTIAGYLLNFGGLSLFSPFLAIIGVALFTPIYREARRLKRVLGPEEGPPAPAAADERDAARGPDTPTGEL